LTTELSGSLQLDAVWEQQKELVAKTIPKRGNSSQVVAAPKEASQKACMKPSNDVEAQSWNRYLCKEALNGYHSKGW
jgi:hypothetical protein